MTWQATLWSNLASAGVRLNTSIRSVCKNTWKQSSYRETLSSTTASGTSQFARFVSLDSLMRSVVPTAFKSSASLETTLAATESFSVWSYALCGWYLKQAFSLTLQFSNTTWCSMGLIEPLSIVRKWMYWLFSTHYFMCTDWAGKAYRIKSWKTFVESYSSAIISKTKKWLRPKSASD